MKPESSLPGAAGCLPLHHGPAPPVPHSEELRDKAYAIVGEPDPVQFGDRVVGIIESRDGTVLDVVREIKDYEFKD